MGRDARNLDITLSFHPDRYWHNDIFRGGVIVCFLYWVPWPS